MRPAEALALLCICALSAAAAAAPRLSVRAIHGPAPVDVVEPVSVNDRGEVAGTLVRYNDENETFIWNGTGPAQVLQVDFGHGLAVNNHGRRPRPAIDR